MLKYRTSPVIESADMSGTMTGHSESEPGMNPLYIGETENRDDPLYIGHTENGDESPAGAQEKMAIDSHLPTLTAEDAEPKEASVGATEPPIVEIGAEVSEIPLRKYSRYTTKKTLAQGLMDVALLMANASQLKAVLSAGPMHEFYELIVTFLIISVILQITTGFILLILGSMDFNERSMERKAGILNNTAVGMIFLITVVNVFISAFGIKLTVIIDETSNRTK